MSQPLIPWSSWHCALRGLKLCLALGFALGADALPAAELEPDWTLRIARGDTLIALSERLLRPPHDWQALKRYNAVTNPRRLVPGNPLRIPLDWLKQEPMLASVVHVEGDVQVRKNAAAGTSQPLLGDALGTDAQVRTGPDSALTLRLSDGSQLLLAPNTEVTVEQLVSYPQLGHSSTRLGLQHGAVESKITPLPQPPPQPLPPGVQRYQIRTPVVTLGVRGTTFRAQVDDADSRAEVLVGEIEVHGSAANTGRTTVPAGFGVTTGTDGRPSAVAALLLAPEMMGPPARDAEGVLVAQWQPVPGATAYRAQVFATPDAADAFAATDRLVRSARWPGTSARWRNLPPGDYHLRVRAIGTRGLEGRNAESGFVLVAFVPPPPRPPPISGLPDDEQRLVGTRVTFTWYAVESTPRYRLQVANNADFAAPLVDENNAAPAAFNLVQSGQALPPGHYFWRVASVGDDGMAGPFGRVRSFDLQAP